MEIDDNSQFEFSNPKDKYVFYLRFNSFKPLDTNPDCINQKKNNKTIFVPVPLRYILLEKDFDHPYNKKRKINNYS